MPAKRHGEVRGATGVMAADRVSCFERSDVPGDYPRYRQGIPLSLPRVTRFVDNSWIDGLAGVNPVTLSCNFNPSRIPLT